MNKDKRNRLIELGAECLTDALLDLANRYEDAEDMIERLIATPAENTSRYKKKLSAIKRRRRFLHRGQSTAFVQELRSLLQDLQDGAPDPETGVKLVAAFYEADGAIFNQCDDSYGNVGDVFRIDAKNLFVTYASQCKKKDRVIDLILKLNGGDDYGIRDKLFDDASEYLSKPALQSMVDQLWNLAQQEDNEHKKRHWILGIESIARQLKDPHLYEQARRALFSELTPAACIDIAQIYLETEDAQTALSWLEKIPEGTGFKIEEKDALLLAIYKKLDNPEKLAEVAWRIFRRYRSQNTLAMLLDAIGEAQRQGVIDGESQSILQAQEFSYSDASFLIQSGYTEDAERYLLSRRDQINGDFYPNVLSLADEMENAGRFLATSALYRALLESILRRAISTYYTHGVRYLKKLDALAPLVQNWQNIPTHTEYQDHLRQHHGRKTSFWSRYKK